MDTENSRGGGWVIAQFVLFALVLIAPRRGPAWPRGVARLARILGLPVLAGGGWLLARAASDLGPNLTPFPKPKDDAELVREGVYATVRHPIYSAIALVSVGWALLSASTTRLAFAVGLVALFNAKATYEESWLLERYPDYAAYREEVPKLFPSLW
jgi:protein-S-isoprenylcysteine O-methyltransferase Ste14